MTSLTLVTFKKNSQKTDFRSCLFILMDDAHSSFRLCYETLQAKRQNRFSLHCRSNHAFREEGKLHDTLICFLELCNMLVILTLPVCKEQKFSCTHKVTPASHFANRMSGRAHATTSNSAITSISTVPRTKKWEKETKLFKMIYIKLRQSTLQAALQNEA